MQRWRPLGCKEGTTWSSFIDILCVALPSAALSRSMYAPSEGAETGSWMTPASARRDSTAGLLNDREAWPSIHLPILSKAGDLTGRERSRGHVRWTDVLERRQQRQLHYRDPSVSPLSPVIENHVKGQLCDTGCPSMQVVPFSQNMTKTTLTG